MLIVNYQNVCKILCTNSENNRFSNGYLSLTHLKYCKLFLYLIAIRPQPRDELGIESL